MPVLVQKFGGSSVGDVEKIRRVAEKVKARRDLGNALVVVVSAMGDTTDELLALAKKVSDDPPRRELDMLLTCGERISMALLSMALARLGVPAISFTGSQSGIITTDDHAQARIVEVRPQRIVDELEKGKVVIVAGYQGVSRSREVTTLGRGGSDTTAVALAAALDAEACEIYSDVDGIFSADPRVVPEARKLEELSYEEMQELASAGAKVLNAQAVEFAKRSQITLVAKSTFGGGTGSVVREGKGGDSRARAVASDSELAVLALGEDDQDFSSLVTFLEARRLRPRVVAYDRLARSGRGYVLLPLQDVHGVDALANDLRQTFGGRVSVDLRLGTVTVVGTGIGHDGAAVRAALEVAREGGAEVSAVHTSPLQISLLLEKEHLAPMARALHRQFGLSERSGAEAGSS